MTRHGKNCTASSVYSYHERKRDAKVSGYGTLHARLGADSIKGFDCCSLTLQPCKNPVVTPNGYLFDREAVLEYILAQKKEIAKRTKEWEKQNALNEEQLQKVSMYECRLLLFQITALKSSQANSSSCYVFSRLWNLVTTRARHRSKNSSVSLTKLGSGLFLLALWSEDLLPSEASTDGRRRARFAP
ncbi:unnamed protein product [Heligmosomoides polygyrus]|uniref:Zf-NOSIP domain-containing protein n=1 Tax=Heligmosomoides polygyrus TaxID=6339 RepID=A0A183GGZ4_HELPZ|nr:unnamed protein product [Heligmosomoides polygyrus]